MMTHSSQMASCGARPRNCTRAICLCHFPPAPRSLVASPVGGNGGSPDQYQTFSGVSDKPVLNFSACLSYSSAICFRQLVRPQPADGLDRPEHSGRQHHRPDQQRHPGCDHVREVDLAGLGGQGLGRVAGHRAHQVRHPDFRAEQAGCSASRTPASSVTQEPPTIVPPLSRRPSSIDISAIATATAMASAVHPVTPAIPGRSAARTEGAPGCSHANQPEQISPAPAGTSRYITKPRSLLGECAHGGLGVGRVHGRRVEGIQADVGHREGDRGRTEGYPRPSQDAGVRRSGRPAPWS